MAISDRIQRHVQKLPASVQAEVLDFVEYLMTRMARRDEQEWSDLSLSAAMRGMEAEPGPEYTAEDLRTVFGI